MLYVSIGILGATVMPHNLYLHSSIVQTRKFEQTPEANARRSSSPRSIRRGALMFALFINAAILILAAAAFHWSGHQDVAEIQDAYKLLSPLLGVSFASILFAVALLASGQNSTLTGTLAGQIVMEGFLNIRITPWLRRLITRGSRSFRLCSSSAFSAKAKPRSCWSPARSCLACNSALPSGRLMRFTGEKNKMGEFANRTLVKILGWTTAVIIIPLNVKLLFDTFMPEPVLKAFYGALGMPAPTQ